MTIIIISKKVKINPDNVATPMAGISVCFLFFYLCIDVLYYRILTKKNYYIIYKRIGRKYW
jgi:hypothetical protein